MALVTATNQSAANAALPSTVLTPAAGKRLQLLASEVTLWGSGNAEARLKRNGVTIFQARVYQNSPWRLPMFLNPLDGEANETFSIEVDPAGAGTVSYANLIGQTHPNG